jgi:predicted nucleic acid-binding protein
MPKITVADTSCLILLNKIGQLELLKKLFGQLTITQTVADEFNINKPLPNWINVVAFNSSEIKGLASFLDLGEATSIALASTHEDSLLIIDENKGRKVAKEMGIQITGSLGIFVTAKQKGYIEAVKPILEEIKRTNFRISENLIQVVLEKVNES